MRVGDTRWGGEARRPHPSLGRNRPGVASAASGASGEETRAPADQHHHPATALLLCALAALRAAALAPASTPGPSQSPAPDARLPCRARSVRNGPGGEARPRNPSATPAQSPVWASPGSPSPFPSRPALASASALSGAPSARQHELQRRLHPADQHAGPYDPRRLRPRPALRDDRRRGRRRQQRRRGHHQEVLLSARHGHRPELGRLLVGTGPTRSARCAWAGGPVRRGLYIPLAPWDREGPSTSDRRGSSCPERGSLFVRGHARINYSRWSKTECPGAPRRPGGHVRQPAEEWLLPRRRGLGPPFSLPACRGPRPASEGAGRARRTAGVPAVPGTVPSEASPLSRAAGGRSGGRGCDH